MEEWDNVTSVVTNLGVASEGGRKFSSGRGFKAVQDSVDDFGTIAAGNSVQSQSGWDDAPSDKFNSDYRGGPGGRDGRGRRGRGVGRSDFRNGDSNNYKGWSGGNDWQSDNNEASGWGDNKNNVDGWGDRNGRDSYRDDGDRRGRDGRGHGGRGRSRGGGGRGGGARGGGGEFGAKTEGLKPRENYIPTENATDEELFTSTITSGINFVKLDEIEVNVTGEEIPSPIQSFQSSGLRPHLLENITKSGYKSPTPIQKYAIPIILSGRDLMGCAQTGSGKTAAFLLPIIHKLLSDQEPCIADANCSQPKVVIISPTRELAIQIYEQAKKFACNSIIKTIVIYGGTSVLHQRSHVLRGCHILVATPGRIHDFVKKGHISFSSVQFVVLDEADRMLDMGFLPTVEQLLGDPSMVATGERQTLMFSATFPEAIQKLAGKFLHNYIFVAVGIVGSASTDVEQVFYQVSKFDKRETLLKLLREDNIRTVVFVETKRTADFLATFLSENDIKTTSIHGDRYQSERELALGDFKKGHCNVLVATGVAARGLDIDGIQHVINYDLPNSIDEYVHRIGRTGRVGNRGKATSFFDSNTDGGVAGGLTRILKQAGQDVPDWLASGDFIVNSQKNPFGGKDIRGEHFGKFTNTQPVDLAEAEW